MSLQEMKTIMTSHLKAMSCLVFCLQSNNPTLVLTSHAHTCSKLCTYKNIQETLNFHFPNIKNIKVYDKCMNSATKKQTSKIKFKYIFFKQGLNITWLPHKFLEPIESSLEGSKHNEAACPEWSVPVMPSRTQPLHWSVVQHNHGVKG